MKIVVYGFMGVGKTTIGELLAERLGYDFIDMDTEIEKREQKSISEIFRVYGEPRFRLLESKLINELSHMDKLVIAGGGGAIADTANANILCKSSRMVYLTATIEEIIERTSHDDKRPLLNKQNPFDIASDLFEKRKPVYQKYAEIIVDTTNKTPDEVVEVLLEELI